jgi:hypothetical protein
MNSDARLRSLLNRSVWAWLPAFIVGLLLTGGPAFAETLKTPAKQVPGPEAGSEARWEAGGSLYPVAIIGDSTRFAGHSDPARGEVLEYHAVDIEQGILFSATGQGITVHDLRSGVPTGGASTYLYGWITGGHFPGWEHVGDSDWFIKHVDAPEGNGTVAALTMDVQGFAVINSQNPAAAYVAYHSKSFTNQVYATKVGNTDWAYALDNTGKVVRFNMSVAQAFVKTCLDVPAGTCAGVAKGAVTSMGSESWVALGGTGTFLATGKWLGGGPVKIWSQDLEPGGPRGSFPAFADQQRGPRRGAVGSWGLLLPGAHRRHGKEAGDPQCELHRRQLSLLQRAGGLVDDPDGAHGPAARHRIQGRDQVVSLCRR